MVSPYRRFSATLLASVATVAVGVSSGMAANGSRSWTPRTGDAYVQWTKANHLSGRSAKWSADVDHDGLRNWGEFRSNTNPQVADSDNDGITDALDDVDHDGLTNGVEYRLRTNPRQSDRLARVRRGSIEIEGSVDAYVAPSASAAGRLTITLGNGMSTLDLPLGTVVTGGAFLIPGAIVRVSVERQDASTTINVQGASDDQSSGGESGEGSGRGKGRGGGDHRDDSVTVPDD